MRGIGMLSFGVVLILTCRKRGVKRKCVTPADEVDLQILQNLKDATERFGGGRIVW